MANVERYGYRTERDKMDVHVAREDARPNPRKTSGLHSEETDQVTTGKQTKRGETVVYPYGGYPYQTIVRPRNAKKQWKRRINEQRDQIGTQVARESADIQPGCARLTVRAHEATALVYKIKSALKGGQLKDKRGRHATSELYRDRTTRVLDTLTQAAKTGQKVTIGVYTREELTTIARQRTHAKHYTTAVRNLERKLKGK